MGESGQVVIVPGVGEVKPLFEERGHAFMKEDERSTAYVYEVEIGVENVAVGWNLTESLFSPVPGGGQPVPEEVSEGANGRVRRDVSDKVEATVVHDRPQTGSDRTGAHGPHDEEDKIRVAMTASSHVGHLRFEFPQNRPGPSNEPYVFIQATRQNWTGSIVIDPDSQEVSGSNPQRQDYALGPYRAPNFSGYFVSRFSQPFASYGVTRGGAVETNVAEPLRPT